MRKRLAIFISFSGQGGVERMVTNLLGELAGYDLDIDLLTIRAEQDDVKGIDKRIRWLPLKAKHSMTSVSELVLYLRRYRPAAMLVAKDRAGRAAIAARLLSGTEVPLAIRLGTNLSASMAHKWAWQRWIRVFPMPFLYRFVSKVIAISDGVAADTRKLTGLPGDRIAVIPNPVITKDIFSLAGERVPHPWLEPNRPCPVVMGAGRLTRQKDFPTLLRAFSLMRGQRPARLVILGEGNDRGELQALARELGLESVLLLPGFQENPYSWLVRADLFVLSSRWEGSGNVLTEAMALGRPVVATDCPSGPGEILDGGRIAPLAPVGDWRALAVAMQKVLDNPPDPAALRRAVREFHVESSTARYLGALGLSGAVRRANPEPDTESG